MALVWGTVSEHNTVPSICCSGCVCVCMHVCMCVCMHACMCVCVCAFACMSLGGVASCLQRYKITTSA